MDETAKGAREGGCRCGQVRFRVTEAPLLTMACHCKGCQQMTGSAFSLSTMHPTAGFEVTVGEPVVGGLHGPNRHLHCPHCMSWVFTRPDGADWLVNVRATMFDDARDFVPFVEMFTDERLPWAKTPAKRSYPRFPDLADYQGLVSEFQAERGGA
ncbi:MAG: GFA family protein [Phenylobacterium sp.]|uniref:GFA family protein n=1 Tax=Phenylobacterium sp. TaxID=1871053 RepID=UPI001A6281A0|nr:GFA family protein [Phenylobacterium sp.]MBL8553309.1 GFA family protein [Phenylobacterium sp.]